MESISPDDLELVRWAISHVEGMSDRAAAKELGVVAKTVKDWREKLDSGKEAEIRPLRTSREKLLNKRNASRSSSLMDLETLDQWGLARARAIEKLADLLEKDRRILEMRAEAALNATIAARIEAEKAPDQSGVPFSSAQIAALERFAERLDRLVPMQGGVAGTKPGEEATLD